MLVANMAIRRTRWHCCLGVRDVAEEDEVMDLAFLKQDWRREVRVKTEGFLLCFGSVQIYLCSELNHYYICSLTILFESERELSWKIPKFSVWFGSVQIFLTDLLHRCLSIEPLILQKVRSIFCSISCSVFFTKITRRSNLKSAKPENMTPSGAWIRSARCMLKLGPVTLLGLPASFSREPVLSPPRSVLWSLKPSQGLHLSRSP